MGRRIFRCISDQCRQPDSGTKNIYASTSLELVCSVCGAAHAEDKSKFLELADTHFILPDPKGPIKGMNRQYKVLCTPGQALKPHPKHMTAEATSVTCEDCLELLGAMPEFAPDPLAL